MNFSICNNDPKKMVFYVKISHILYLCIIGITPSLTECVGVVVIGHYSVNGGACEDHFNYKEGESRPNYVIVNNVQQMLEYVVGHFSPSGGTVLDLTENKGH